MLKDKITMNELYKLMDKQNNYKGYNIEIYCKLLHEYKLLIEINKNEVEYLLKHKDYLCNIVIVKSYESITYFIHDWSN